VIERAREHLGEERAGRYLRKFYPWYVERLGGTRALQAAVQQAPGIEQARELLGSAEVRMSAHQGIAGSGREAARPGVYTHPPA
jgi:hypothetical protein